MRYGIWHLPSSGRALTGGSGRLPCWVAAALLAGCIPPACAQTLTGEIQAVAVPSKDREAQRSLTEISVYLEYELANGISAFGVGYHDQEFRSATIGLARKLGDWQLGLGLGQATFDEMNHLVVNPWVYYADDNYKGYIHYESYRNGSAHSHFMKGYALKNLGRLSVGAHAEIDFGVGPRIEIRLVDGLKLWGVVPVAHRPQEGAMKGMLGVTAEF